MKELSTEEMTSLRGGTPMDNSTTALSFGNVALAIPIDITVLSGNAFGSGAQGGIGEVLQIAEAIAGTQSFKL